jgi:hypothetical protein
VYPIKCWGNIKVIGSRKDNIQRAAVPKCRQEWRSLICQISSHMTICMVLGNHGFKCFIYIS